MALRTLVILQGYDPSGPTLRTFYLTNTTPFITTPSETPASQSFDAALSQPLDVRRRVQSIRGGAVLPSIGEVRIHNQDGVYDAWLGYAFDGRSLVVRMGPEQGAYPSEYPVTFTGQIERCDVQGDEIVLRVRDAVAALNAPLADSLYLGDNVAPDGLEGGAELEGRPKPLVFGQVKGVPLVPVNSSKLIYQVSDSAVQSVDDVYDNGVALGPYAPVDFGNLNATTGGYSADTDGTTIVVGDTSGGNPAIRTTTDGVSFSTIGSLPFVSAGVTTGMAYSSTLDRFVAVTDGGEIAYSDDAGATWTLSTPGAGTASFNRVRWCPRRELFVAVGEAGRLQTSPTGVTFTTRSSGVSGTINLNDVAVGGPVLVAVGDDGGSPTPVSQATRSTDGTTWTAQALSAQYRRAAHQVDGWVFTSGSTTSSIARSRDGSSWVDAPAFDGRTGQLYSLHSAGGYLVAVYFRSNSTYCVTVSTDLGVTWTAVEDEINGTLPEQILPFADRWFVFSRTDTDRSGAPSQYANLTDLEDDTLAPVPGTYKWASDAAGSYVRLGSSPFGAVTADATQGATAADRTAAQLFTDVLVRAGYSAADWSASDITALDTADNSEVGLFLDDDTTIADALDALARTVGAWWGIDTAGDFRIAQLTAPSGSSTFSITENDIRGRLERIASSDPLLGLPSYRTTLRYVLADSTTLDGTVVDTDTAVQTTHLLAEATVEDTLYTVGSDAQAEATRRQTLRGTARSAYRVTVSLEDYASVDLGAVGTLTHPRFGLSGGALVRVLGVEPDARNRSVTLTLWR